MPEQARPIDGAEGYRLFLEHDGDIELDEINEHLRGIGLRELQPRSLQHFKKLRRHGYKSYITQNRLDLAVAGEDAWSDDMRAHYPEVRQAFPAELLFDAEWHPVTVQSLGLAGATVTGDELPSVGTPVVLKLATTRIERMASVFRLDPGAGRIDLVFDPYSALPTASDDAPFELDLSAEMEGNSENLVAFAELLLRVERLVTRLHLDDNQIPRIASIRKSSPLFIQMIGDASLPTAATVIAGVAGARLVWYQGTKTKYEAQGIAIDNEQKRQMIQKEADAGLLDALEAEEDTEDTPQIDALEVEGIEKGSPQTPERRAFIDVCRAAIALPVGLSARSFPRRPPPQQE